MKALIDTCVIIDALEGREPFKNDAENIFLSSANSRFDGYISAKTIADTYYILHKYLHDKNKTKQAISNLLQLFFALDTCGEDCINALSSNMDDYEDAILSEGAKRENIDYIVTRNIKDFSLSSVKAITPNEFLELFD